MRPDHIEIEELLGVYALHAVDEDERSLVEKHLVQCAHCSTEVEQHREVATLIGGETVQPPQTVWNRIAAELEAGASSSGFAPVVPLRQPRTFGRSPVWLAGAAAAAVFALGAAVVFQSGRIGDLNTQLAAQEEQITTLAASLQVEPLQQAVTAALSEPDARIANLTGEGTRDAMLIVVRTDGTGYVFQSTLPDLPPDATYQLWAVVDDKVISAGVLGTSPGIVPFHIDPASLQGLVITREVAGGVAVSQQDPVVAWFDA